jgi:hypothetical protein
LAVQQEALVAKADNGVPADLKGVYRSGTTDVEDEEVLMSGMNMSTAYAWGAGGIQTADPDGAAWTADSINNLQVGLKVGG